MSKIVYACDTPLQVLNAINMQVNQCANCESDIMVYNQFSNARQIAERLENTKIFKHVYVVEQYKKYSGIIQKIVTLFRMLFPYYTLKKHIKNNKIEKEKYSTVVFSFITTFSITVFGISKPIRFIQLEDGIGTYIGNILNDYASGMLKKIVNITKYRRIFMPEKIMLYNPAMYSGNFPVVKLENDFSREIGKKIEFVYEYSRNDLYMKSKCIYLSQPFQTVKGYNIQNHEQVNQVLSKYKQNLLVRIHPREQENLYEGFHVDSVKNLWELECINQIDDDNILIGGFSTAQIMPKILRNKEPYIVLLYKLLIEDASEEYEQGITDFVERFKCFYTNPGKIYVPKTISEFETILWDIMKAEKKQ